MFPNIRTVPPFERKYYQSLYCDFVLPSDLETWRGAQHRLKNECILSPRQAPIFFTKHSLIFILVFPRSHYTNNTVISEKLYFEVKVDLKFLSGIKTKFLFIVQGFNYKSLRKPGVRTELSRPTRFYKYVRRVIIWKPSTYLQPGMRNSSGDLSKLRLNKCLGTLTTPSHFTTSKFREVKVEYLAPIVCNGDVLSSHIRQETGHPQWHFSWISWSLQVNTGIKLWTRPQQISFASISHHFRIILSPDNLRVRAVAATVNSCATTLLWPIPPHCWRF